jgi:Zn-dependent peptidase ImmA (M78 family)
MKKVKVLGRTFEVIYCDLRKEQETEAHGYVLYKEQKIYIDNHLNNIEKQESTLLHEIIHIIYDILGLKQDENVINLLEAGLYQVFKDNDILGKT